MKHRLLRVIAPLLCLATITSATMAYGQVTTALSGTVTDTSGAVLPGADIVAKADETGTTFTAVTNDHGNFTIPAIPIGRYTVTVSLQGFKTVALSDIRVSTATAAQVTVKLELGQLSETVTVRSGTEVVQTQANTLGSTLTTEQITRLPLVTRDTLWGAVPFLAGVDTTTGPRASTINGLPSGAINISIDGVNTQDNNNRSATGTGGGCGFFSLISPRLDAVEEVTIATGAQGADSAGQGAVQINTRRAPERTITRAVSTSTIAIHGGTRTTGSTTAIGPRILGPERLRRIRWRCISQVSGWVGPFRSRASTMVTTRHSFS